MLGILRIGELLGKLEERLENVAETASKDTYRAREELGKRITDLSSVAHSAENLAEQLKNDQKFYSESRERHEERHRKLDDQLLEIRNTIRNFTGSADSSNLDRLELRLGSLEKTVKAIDEERSNLFDQYNKAGKATAAVEVGLKTKVDHNQLHELEKRLESFGKAYNAHMAEQHAPEPEEEPES